MRTNRDHQFAVDITMSASASMTSRQFPADARRFAIRYACAARRLPALNCATGDHLATRKKGLRR